MTSAVRPKRDGTPEERSAYQAMVERVVARAKPLPAGRLDWIAKMFRSGRREARGE